MAQPLLRLADDDGRGFSRVVSFNVRTLESLTIPPGKDRLTIYDQRTPGLTFTVRGSSRTFYLYRRIDGRPAKLKLGSFPEMTIEQARKAVARNNGLIAQGQDPRVAKRAARAEMRLKDLYAKWLDSPKAKKKRTRADDEKTWTRYMGPLESHRLSMIHAPDVMHWHANIGEKHGPYSANRALALLSIVFNHASSIGIEIQNPTKGKAVHRFPEEQRERFLQPDELPRFFAAVEAESNETLRDLIKLYLFTGARRSNVQAMKWEQLDLDQATWAVPKELAKGGESIVIHLSQPAIDILSDRKQSAKPNAVYVFPSYSKTGHVVEPKTAWFRILTAAKIKDLRIHDLRRTFGSWQAIGGSSLPVIGKSLGHAAGSPATAIYSRLTLDPIRASVNAATAAMLATVDAAKEKAKAKEQSKG